jgi:hypothetical protein
MTDNLQPDYFKKLKSGEYLDIGEVESTKDTWNWNPGDTTWRGYTLYGGKLYNTHYTRLVGSLCHPPLWRHGYTGSKIPNYGGVYPDWPEDGDLTTSALARARSKAFDVSTFLAELDKTHTMIARFRDRTLHRAKVVADAVSKRRRGAGRAVRTGASAFAETWLEARYGWRILAYDIAGVNEAIENLKRVASPMLRGYDTAMDSTSSTVFQVVDDPVNYYGPYSSTGSGVHGKVDATCVQSVIREKRAGSIVQTFLQNSLSVDPLITAWEIVPFSFIVDWFTTIDENLRAFSPFATSQLKGSWISSKETLLTQTDAIAKDITGTSGGSTTTGSLTGNITHEKITYLRYEVTPHFGLSFEFDFNASKFLDLASLFFLRYGRLLGGLRSTIRV